MNRISGLKPHEEFYQMGEEGNGPEAYEMHTTRTMKRLIYRDFVISTKYPNNIVLTTDRKVCVVNDLAYDSVADCFMVTVAPFNHQGDFFTILPCNSSDCDIYSVSGGVNYAKKKVINSSEVVNQFVCLLNDRVMNANKLKRDAAAAAGSSTVTAIEKNKEAHWVCIPLMHVQYR
jgi:hypothetical protein